MNAQQAYPINSEGNKLILSFGPNNGMQIWMEMATKRCFFLNATNYDIQYLYNGHTNTASKDNTAFPFQYPDVGTRQYMTPTGRIYFFNSPPEGKEGVPYQVDEEGQYVIVDNLSLVIYTDRSRTTPFGLYKLDMNVQNEGDYISAMIAVDQIEILQNDTNR